MRAISESKGQASSSKKKETEKLYVYDPAKLEQEIRDINDELSVPPSCSPDICSYTWKHACTKIQQELFNLKRMGFQLTPDFSKRPFFQNAHNSYQYQIKRAIKLRFKCKNNRCSQFKRDEEEDHMRKWTTYYGMVIFSFYFERIPNKIFYKLRINFKIYGQQCQTCKQWGSGSIIQPDLLRLARLYSIIVEIVMHQRLKLLDNHDLEKGIELEVYEKYGKAPDLSKTKSKGDIQMIGRVLRHRQSLCQACNKGVCMHFYRPPRRKMRRM